MPIYHCLLYHFVPLLWLLLLPSECSSFFYPSFLSHHHQHIHLDINLIYLRGTISIKLFSHHTNTNLVLKCKIVILYVYNFVRAQNKFVLSDMSHHIILISFFDTHMNTVSPPLQLSVNFSGLNYVPLLLSLGPIHPFSFHASSQNYHSSPFLLIIV